MENLKYKVCVVTVTYGNRWTLVNQIIARSLSFVNVSHVVLVNNASSYDIDEKLATIADDRVILIDSKVNLGSTGGYKVGIAKANELDIDFVWLLDDDNLPEENALDALLSSWDDLGTAPDKTAFFCLRTDRIHHIQIAQGEDPYRYYLIPDNFLNFTCLRPFSKFLKITDKFKRNRKYKNRVEIPFASYGGFFFHKKSIDKIGYPDEKFYLYFDDAEYTYRVTHMGGKVWLIPGSIINDIDQSFQVNYKRKYFHSIYLDMWSFRTYYTTRNCVYFYKKYATKNEFIFKLNKFLFMNWLKMVSIITSKQAEYQKMKVAVQDGLDGNMGQADPSKF